LESLGREKAHAEKLKKNIADLRSNIAAKETEYLDLQQRFEDITMSNKRFVEQASHFREIYIRAENAHKQKTRLEEELREILTTVRELDGKLFVCQIENAF